MAEKELTQEDIALLLDLAERAKRGKRITDLPPLGAENPLDLRVEVIGGDGESKQARLAALLPYLEDQCAYGIEWDTTVPTPACTRIGNLALHRTLPVQRLMKGCLLDDNGRVEEYLAPTNWKAHQRDGSNGQVMVEIPAHYRKFETEGTKRRAWISLLPLPGYHAVGKSYISAYEASVQRSTQKLCSVVNMDADYRGGNNQVAWDGTYRTLLGRPATNLSRTSFRKFARNRNAASTEWNCLDYNVYKAVVWLYYIEYANLNSQAPFNAQKDANGYAQGGLGDGVTTAPDWNGYNGTNPFVPCGASDGLGNLSGEVAYAMPQEDGSTHAIVNANRYRGIENPFGHIWKWVDGINVAVQSEADGGKSMVYVCDDPAKYSDTGYEGYSLRGEEARQDGFIKEMILGEFGEIVPSAVGGGSTTYFCDYHYTNVPDSGTPLRSVQCGGNVSRGAAAGLGCVGLNNSPSSAPVDVGTRLCFIPKN